MGRAIGIAGAPLEVWVEGSALEVLAEGAPGEALAGAARVATVPARAASPNREAAAALARRVLITWVFLFSKPVVAGWVEKRIERGPQWILNTWMN